MEPYKTQLILNYVLPALGLPLRGGYAQAPALDEGFSGLGGDLWALGRQLAVADKQLPDFEGLLQRIASVCRLQTAIKYQELEVPGPYGEGRVWFSVSAMAHSYCCSSGGRVKKGTRIWKKRKFILFSSSLLEKENRDDYVQLLEPGEVLSIRYHDMPGLMTDYPELEQYIRRITVDNERYYHHRNLLMGKPSTERIIQFRKENELFINCTSQEVQAMHVNLSRVAYIRQLKNIRP